MRKLIYYLPLIPLLGYILLFFILIHPVDTVIENKEYQGRVTILVLFIQTTSLIILAYYLWTHILNK